MTIECATQIDDNTDKPIVDHFAQPVAEVFCEDK